MRTVYLTILLISGIVSMSSCQNIKISRATEQILNHGIRPAASVNYLVNFYKKGNYGIQFDSVKTIADTKSLSFTLFKKDKEGNFIFTKEKVIKQVDSGYYQLAFGIVKSLGDDGRPQPEGEDMPPPLPPPPDVSKGFTIYYTVKGKKKTLIITKFEKLESLSAP